MTQKRTKLIDWVLLLSCNLMWASQFVVVKLVQEQMGPLFAVTLPIALSTLLLAALVHREPKSKVTRQDIWAFVLLGIAGQLVAQLFITWGVRIAPASNAALLALVMPVSTAVMAHFLLGEHMTAIRWISFGLAILGVLACSGVDWKDLKFGSGYLAGNVLIFLSVLGSAFYNAYSKKALERYSPLESPTVQLLRSSGSFVAPHFCTRAFWLFESAALFGYCLGWPRHPRHISILSIDGHFLERADTA